VATTLLQSDLPGLTLRHRGKVRDVFELPADGAGPASQAAGPLLLIVASDRLSAFDVVLPDPIPGKGEMLCQISNFWFGQTAHLVPNHLTGIDVASVLPAGVDAGLYAQRAVVTRKLKPVPIEAIARGYLIGSGWKDYQRTGRVSGIALPDGLRQAEQLPQPIFTPSTKATIGDHDENIDFDTMVKTVGADLAEQVRDATLRLYTFARDHAAQRGILLADTKFEFGTDADGRLYVMDEMLTPDSSRYWPADGFVVGETPPSFDKQYVRDWATASGWDKRPPAPAIPDDVIAGTRDRYAEAYERITGEPLSAWYERTGAGTG
jgi:phosphoribosylaminoimidazole-succinocarboxamide synthase